MKWLRGSQFFRLAVFGFNLLLAAGKLFAADRPERLYIPFLEPASQSNVVVTVLSMSTKGDPCPAQFTNTLSNTNLFTLKEQKMIGDALVKYKNVSTNSGPPGTVLVNCYQTNVVVPPLYWMETNATRNFHRTNEFWVSCFQYTNSEAQEEIRFYHGGWAAKFKNGSNDGYTASIARTGNGSLLTVTERKYGSDSGLLVRFDDSHAQGTTWDYHLADFNDGRLQEYMQTTNGLAFGKWLVWNASTGGLIMAAECKEPYDWNNHRMKLPLR